MNPDIKYVNVQGRLLKLSNLNKVFYPVNGFTKREILSYYQQIGPAVIPHLRDRPFTLKRFPEGVGGTRFYEKQCPHYRQPWIKTGRFGSTRYCMVNDLPTLLWAVNLAAIELHTTLGLMSDPDVPTMCVFDLDPGEGTDLRDCAEVALLMGRLFAELRLEAVPKTSGMKGIHLLLPLNAGQRFKLVREFTRRVAELMEAAFPGLVTAKMPKKYRGNKVYIDWQQNADFKTTTTVYSLRANELPTVSTPLLWSELVGSTRLQFEPDEVLRRVRDKGELAAMLLTKKQRVPEITPEMRKRLLSVLVRAQAKAG